jgi:hypothetical protein
VSPGSTQTPTTIGNSQPDRDQALLVNAQAFAKRVRNEIRPQAKHGLVRIAFMAAALGILADGPW